MLQSLKDDAIIVLTAILLLISVYAYILSGKLDKANIALAVIDNASAEQVIKTVQVTKEIEVIKWKTKEKIKYVTEYVYDENKSDCNNGMDLLRSQF